MLLIVARFALEALDSGAVLLSPLVSKKTSARIRVSFSWGSDSGPVIRHSAGSCISLVSRKKKNYENVFVVFVF